MRVLVTGSRTWTDPQPIRDALDRVAASVVATSVDGHLTLIHGGAHRGADNIANAWAADAHHHGWPVTVERHPADWPRYGTPAGILRNIEMVQAGADLVLAFIRDNSPGATHCARTAREAGIPTRILRWEDRHGGLDA